MPNSPGAFNIHVAANRQTMDIIREQRVHWHPTFVWRQIVNFDDFSAAGLTEALNLNTKFPNNPFPTNVLKGACWVERIVALAGGSVSDAKLEIGDAAADNCLLTSSDVDTGAGSFLNTPAATEYDDKALETAFVPLATLTTVGGNINTLTAGRFQIFIQYQPVQPLG